MFWNFQLEKNILKLFAYKSHFVHILRKFYSVFDDIATETGLKA